MTTVNEALRSGATPYGGVDWDDPLHTKDFEKLKDRELVFVYGSLMEGFGNHRILGTNATKVGDFVTNKRYRLVDLDAFPAMTKLAGTGVTPSQKARLRSKYRPVIGEVYYVDKLDMIYLDHLESNGYLYQRERILVTSLEDGEVHPIRPWCYLFKQPKFLSENKDCVLDENDFYSWRATCDYSLFKQYREKRRKAGDKTVPRIEDTFY